MCVYRVRILVQYRTVANVPVTQVKTEKRKHASTFKVKVPYGIGKLHLLLLQALSLQLVTVFRLFPLVNLSSFTNQSRKPAQHRVNLTPRPLLSCFLSGFRAALPVVLCNPFIKEYHTISWWVARCIPECATTSTLRLCAQHSFRRRSLRIGSRNCASGQVHQW